MNKPIEPIAINGRGIWNKLQQARVQLQGVKMKKSGHNKFAGYTYFELGDFLPTINEIFNVIGLCGVVSFTASEATLRIVDTESGQEAIFTCPMASAQLKGCHEVQNLGASITYIRRYLYVTALEIVEHDALDATTGADVKASAKSVAKAEFDSSSRDTQDKLQSIATGVLAAFEESDEEGMAAYQNAKNSLTTEEQVALWSLFDSKTRAYIKRLGTKKEPTAMEMAQQA